MTKCRKETLDDLYKYRISHPQKGYSDRYFIQEKETNRSGYRPLECHEGGFTTYDEAISFLKELREKRRGITLYSYFD